MTREEAIERARALAEARGWTWRGTVEVTKVRRWRLFGPYDWSVRSNTGAIGSNVRVRIEDRTGRVVEAGFLPR